MPEVTAGFLHDGVATSAPLVSESTKNRPACGDCRLSVFVRLIWDCVTGDAAFTVTYRVKCQVFKVVLCPSEVERARPAPHDADHACSRAEAYCVTCLSVGSGCFK